MFINGYKLVNTCKASPEAYDVFQGEEKVARLKLRRGVFRAYVEKDVVYEGRPYGGSAFYESERMMYLIGAVVAVNRKREVS